MSAARRPMRIAGRLARVACAALIWSCADLLNEPAPGTPRPLSIRFTESPGVPQASIAAAGADAVRIRVERPTEEPPPEIVVDTVLPLSTDGEEARLRLALSGALIGATLDVHVELLAGSAPVFRGSATTTLSETGTTVVDLPIQPIVAAVRVGDDPPTITSLGDAIDLSGEALFASGNAVPGATLSWRALDGGVVEVTAAGRATAIGEGEARVEGGYGGHADTLRVAVAQVVTALEVEPATVTLRPDQRLTFTATARDANGRVAAGRAPTWASSSVSIVTVDAATGQAQGRSAGGAQITATLGDIRGAASVTVANPGPVIARISPSTVTAGTAGFELSVSGSGFVSGSTVRWNGAARQTRRISADELRATIPATDIITPGLASVTVANPAPGGGTSAAVQFTVVAAAAPTAPTGLTATRAGLVVDLAWTDRSANESGFRVERRVGDGPWQSLTETAPNAESYRDASLAWGGRYRYRVLAVGSGGVSQPSNEVEIVARDAPRVETSPASDVRPGAATMSGITNGNGLNHDVWLVWRAEGLSLHETRRSSSAPRCTPDQECTWSWIRGNLYAGQAYEFWLQAESEAGIAAGDTLRFVTPPPVAPTVEAVSERLTGQNGVRLEYRVTPGGEDFRTWLEIGRRADMQRIDLRSQEQQQTLRNRAGSPDPWSFELVATGLRRGTTYYWRAAARGATGEVVYSETRRFDSQGGGGDGDDD